jgi:hypothetical protein
MQTYALKLEIETDRARTLGAKEVAIIERYLNAHFLDAKFKLTAPDPKPCTPPEQSYTGAFITDDGKLVDNAFTAQLNDWERNALKHMAKKPYQTSDPHHRVRILRLRKKLPTTHKITIRRKEGYRLVKA